MRNQLMQAMEMLTSFRFKGVRTEGEVSPVALFLVRCLLGAVLSLAALFLSWCVGRPVIAAALGALALTALHHCLVKENEGRTPLALLGRWRKDSTGRAAGDDAVYYQSLAGYCLGLKPLLLFLLLYCGCWYWVLAAYALGAAIALDGGPGKTADDRHGQLLLWGGAVALSVAVTILTNLSSVGESHAVMSVVLVSIVAWLLPNWLGRLPLGDLSLGSRFYIGEVAVLLVLLCCIAL